MFLCYRSDITVVGDIAERSGHEVLVQNFEASVQLPNQNDEAAEVVVVVDQNLSVRTTDAHTHSLRTEEQGRRSVVRNRAVAVVDVNGDGLVSKVGGFEETSGC